MKLSNILVLLVSGASSTLASPVPEAAPEPVPLEDTVKFVEVPVPNPSTKITIQRRQNLVVQVCGGANWQACTDVSVYANTHVTQPLNTFGSFNTRGSTCHCYNGASTYSNPFSGSLGNVMASWGDFWFYNCKQIGCW
ncbi:hypothetical protein QBC37DRAFT_406459 [Rhypophila decipiens]|uniref:Uncharacterized protein n=1 Tax=Rhypophila decipiens TaxID=261697 RepID=A0AAN7B266_9PEZI|nr:hypothetical protein QBC37DRAFT_406459 [Rhypophila decipiens]